MKGLKKRVDDLEYKTNTGENAVTFLWIDEATDGGLVHKGKFYKDSKALIRALGIDEQKEVYLFHWQATHTAAELLARENSILNKRKLPGIPELDSKPSELDCSGNGEERMDRPPKFVTPMLQPFIMPELEDTHRQQFAITQKYPLDPNGDAVGNERYYGIKPAWGYTKGL